MIAMAGSSKEQLKSDSGQLWEDIKSRPLLEIVGISSLSTVGTLLNVSNPVTKGWEALAETLGYSRVEIEALRHEGNKPYQRSPGVLLLEGWGGRGASSTVQVLEQALLDLDRLDVIEELQQATKDQCNLSVTFHMGQHERSLTLPGVPGMSTLRQALEGAIEQTGLSTDAFEIHGSEMTWSTRARECKGKHLHLVQKKFPQPRHVSEASPTDSPREPQGVEDKPRNNRPKLTKASTVSGPVATSTSSRVRPAIPVQRSQSERSALHPKDQPNRTASPTINIFAAPGTSINILNGKGAMTEPTPFVESKSTNGQRKEASVLSSTQNPTENAISTPHRSDISAERNAPSSETIGEKIPSRTTERSSVCAPVQETKEQVTRSKLPLPKEETFCTSVDSFHKGGLEASSGKIGPRPLGELKTQSHAPPKLPPKKNKPSRTASQVPIQEEGSLQQAEEDIYSRPLAECSRPTPVPVVSEIPCGSSHGDRRRQLDSVLDDVNWEEIANVPGFHHDIPDDNAAIYTFMFNYLRDEGWYVIRKCADNKLAVSVTYLGDIRHYRIHHTDGRFYFRRDEFQACSLHELIETYKWNDLPAKTDRSSAADGSGQDLLSSPPVPARNRGVRLLNPV
ncbi:uncharacterized protein LOC118416122 isoform X2 [Branchiostoma floridae]|uniref:Uncharacterized protein LOC118416122 isoform X2 n=1 Tax=Branchiostoma floridae TaxID=7739 RepID=A0A9J7MRJ9_BRAFL|nr:uncharacterized protein LOC118416122 isoform X2 [Branchiostoma floridae]